MFVVAIYNRITCKNWYNTTMSESLQHLAAQNLMRDTADSQYINPFNVRLRWDYYKDVDLFKSIVDKLELQGDETILDIGCADGRDLRRLDAEFGHTGRLIGSDLYLGASEYYLDNGYTPLETNEKMFIAADAESIPLADDSIDVLMALFVLYHVNDPQKALEEFKRVVKPGGTVVIATSGKGNKLKHREFEAMISDSLGLERIPIFSAKFDADVAEEALPAHFENIRTFYQQDTRRYTLEDYSAYIASIDSMKDSLKPIPPWSLWKNAVDELVVPAVLSEIAEKGVFEDAIDRWYFICKNSPAA